MIGVTVYHNGHQAGDSNEQNVTYKAAWIWCDIDRKKVLKL